MIIVETEFMKVEILPVEADGEDVIYGETHWSGEHLRVTVKRGLLGDTRLLNYASSEYMGLSVEKPTTVFTLLEPHRKS